LEIEKKCQIHIHIYLDLDNKIAAKLHTENRERESGRLNGHLNTPVWPSLFIPFPPIFCFSSKKKKNTQKNILKKTS